MGYLITQILIYLALAAVIGFLMAWVLRGTRLGARIEELEAEVWDLRQQAGRSDSTSAASRPAAAAPVAAAPAVAVSPPPARRAAAAKPAPSPKPASPSPKPAAAAAPAAGQPPAMATPGKDADDLKRIKGIGPKIEGILHSLGIHHFHQIAGWNPENVEWVNGQLRFKGRIQREKWIEQAKELSR